MASITSLTVSNGHIDSLVDYVLDVKPYHTKLSEIVEEYIFEDTVSVGVVDVARTLEVLGRDFLAKSNNPLLKIWENSSTRSPSVMSGDKTFAPGDRSIYSVPSTLFRKLFSYSSKDKFTVSNSDTSEIPGLNLGVLSRNRFDGPGIPKVTKNGTALAEGIGYHISYGAFSFIADGTAQTWKQANLSGLSEFPDLPGALFYQQVSKPYGQIVSITGSNTAVEEWTLTWNAANSWLVVSGSSSGTIGHATFNTPFVNAKLNFTFTYALNQTDPPVINDGDQFILTPRGKIVVHPSAPHETWTLIKTNPISLTGTPVFSGAAGPTPSISVYERSLTATPSTTFTVVYTSPTTYSVLSSAALGGYPKTGQTSLSFYDQFLSFTIQPNGRTFSAGDSFSFTVTAAKTHYLVYGSGSGWQTPATIGQWYFNGKIGFKIPTFDYFPAIGGNIVNTDTNFVPLSGINAMARASVYTITFRQPVLPSTTVLTATVENNIYGFRQGLTVGQPWSDEFCSFQLNGTYNAGDVISVYLAPRDYFTAAGGYDDFPYDTTPYDAGIGQLTYPEDLLQDYFPLYHSYGSVIVPTASNNDVIIIDKIEYERVRLKLPTAPELANTVDGWVPLDFRFDVPFPDYVSVASAYLCSDPSVKVFEIRQPQASDGYPGLAVLEFDATFFSNYVSGQSSVTLRFHQASSWEQYIRVKVSENLYIDATIDLEFADAPPNDAETSISDGLKILQYESAVLSVVNLVLNIADINATLYVTDDVTNYVISFRGPASVTKLQITPDVGAPFTVTLNPHPYDQVPTATSAWGYSFTVPAHTAPFTVSHYLTGLGFDLGGDLGGV